ncbi:MAG: helix-hairpin-helix domain-containing protein, partial [Tannerellaceae bacterium]|nr:helix-hairpin-helix domain-containing protein [Tannerellaceae bacterium]
MDMVGIHINRDINRLTIGLTGVYYGFSKSYQPDIKPYSLFTLKGKNFYNGGIDYSYYGRNFSLSGETGWDKNGNLAILT